MGTPSKINLPSETRTFSSDSERRRRSKRKRSAKRRRRKVAGGMLLRFAILFSVWWVAFCFHQWVVLQLWNELIHDLVRSLGSCGLQLKRGDADAIFDDLLFKNLFPKFYCGKKMRRWDGVDDRHSTFLWRLTVGLGKGKKERKRHTCEKLLSSHSVSTRWRRLSGHDARFHRSTSSLSFPLSAAFLSV